MPRGQRRPEWDGVALSMPGNRPIPAPRRRRAAIGPDRKVVSILCGTQEQHISADIAYAVWQYWLATGDEGFLLDAGAEILFETGRFWASRAQLEADGHCHIRGVIGPDEYHEHIDDNAFTNGMARWNIRRALDVAALLRERWPERWERLSSRLGLDDAELQHWLSVAEKMATGLDAKTGLLEQFSGLSSRSRRSTCRITRAVCANGRGAWARADAEVSGDQAGRCRRAAGSLAGRV